MKFSFGIITSTKTCNFIHKIIDSINNLSIKEYEIIIVGGENIYRNLDKVIHIPYVDINEISKKKNIITESASYDNIVYLHDYIIFEDNWYEGFLKFENDFDVCMTKIKNLDDTRYRDWCLWCDDADKFVKKFNYLIPYDMTHLSKLMYISGAYWVAKKQFMIQHKLNEKLLWGQGEDVEWSIRARNSTNFKMNNFSSVKLLKYKDRYFNEPSPDENKILSNINSYDDSESYQRLIDNHIKQWII
jgi:hypothetical protein